MSTNSNWKLAHIGRQPLGHAFLRASAGAAVADHRKLDRPFLLRQHRLLLSSPQGVDESARTAMDNHSAAHDSPLLGDDAGHEVHDDVRVYVTQDQVLADDAVFEILGKLRQAQKDVAAAPWAAAGLPDKPR